MINQLLSLLAFLLFVTSRPSLLGESYAYVSISVSLLIIIYFLFKNAKVYMVMLNYFLIFILFLTYLLISSLSSHGNLLVAIKTVISFILPVLSLLLLMTIKDNSKYFKRTKCYILNYNFFNQPNEIVFRSLIELFSKVGNKYYPPRGKSVVKLLSNFWTGKIKKINISGCILEKVNNSFIIYKEN